MLLTIKLCTYAKLNCLKELFICIKMDLALNTLLSLICRKTRINKDLYQLSEDTRCSLEDLLELMDDRDGWEKRVRKLPTQFDDEGSHVIKPTK